MPKNSVRLASALDYLKSEIGRNEEKLKLKQADGYGRMTLERLNEWLFERGVNLISFAKPNEIDSDLIDWFFGRIEGERPDIKKIEKRWKEEEQREQEAQKSWKGLIKFWLWKLKEKIRCWYR